MSNTEYIDDQEIIKTDCIQKCEYLLKELKYTFDELYPVIDNSLYNELCNYHQQLNIILSKI